MSERPKRIRILGKRFTVSYPEAVEGDLVGECDTDSQTIAVQDKLPLESEQDTLIHEVLHAIDEMVDSKLRESQVKRLATGLLAILRENDDLARYLTLKPCAACGAPQRTKNRPYCAPCNVKKVREWQKAHPEAKKKYRWKKLYNLSEEDYLMLFSAQKGKCANAGCERVCTDVDHDHATGKVRGLLCNQCNMALGLLKDEPKLLSGLVDYLLKVR